MKCLSIHLTDLCNSACSFCVVASPLYASNTVKDKDIEEFLAKNSCNGYDAVNLHGGEPTIHPRFIEILELIQSLGYRDIHLQTNGIKLSEEDFTRKLVDLGVTRFIVSLHGDTAEIQDHQTCTDGGFEKTLSGIRNVKSCGAHVRTNTVITTYNVDRLYQLTQLACNLKIDHINYSNLHPVGSARYALGRLLPSFDEVRKNLYPAVDLAMSQERKVTLEGFPYCVVRERMNLHLDNEYREVKMLMRGSVIENYDEFMNRAMRTYGVQCELCTVKVVCGGVYPQYIEYRGWGEFSSVDDVKDLETNEEMLRGVALQRLLT